MNNQYKLRRDKNFKWFCFKLYNRKKGFISSIIDIFDVSRAYIRKFIENAAKYTKEGSKVLDVGAGEITWEYLFPNCEYYTQDNCLSEKNWDYSKIDYKSDIINIPTQSNSFDAIIMTEVLEHLSEPVLALKELNRILKNNGKLYLTVPQGWAEHEQPYDFFRYTSFGLEYILEKANFKIISIEKRGGYFKYIGMRLWRFTQLPCMTRNKLFTIPLRIIVTPFFIIISITCYLIDDWDKEKELTLGYQVIAKKENENVF